MRNRDIRLLAAGAGVKLWEIAEELGLTDSSFSRVLRKELNPEKKEEIREIIARLSKREGVNDT